MTKLIIDIKKTSFISILLIFAIAIDFTIIGNGLNILLISVSIILLIINYRFVLIFNKENYSFYFLPVLMLMPLLSFYENFEFLSYLYGLMFILIFHLYNNFLDSNEITVTIYKKVLTTIMILYFCVALLQMLFFPLGIYINKIWDTNLNELRINSLATEPSYTGIIFVITFFSFIQIRKLENNEVYNFNDVLKDWFYWFSAIFLVLVTRSSYSIIFFAILLFSLISKKTILYVFVIFFFMFYLIKITHLESVDRFLNLLVTFFTFDVEAMANAEHSGSIRIAPVVILFENFDLFNLKYWIGYGIGYNKALMADLIPGININEWEGGGFFPSCVLDYGLIFTFLFLHFLKSTSLRKLFGIDLLFLFLIFLNASFNSQLFWFSIMIFASNKSFILKSSNLITTH